MSDQHHWQSMMDPAQVDPLNIWETHAIRTQLIPKDDSTHISGFLRKFQPKPLMCASVIVGSELAGESFGTVWAHWTMSCQDFHNTLRINKPDHLQLVGYLVEESE
jgi:hypothetical protein